MANPFDALQVALAATIATAFGYEATWEPSGGGEMQTAQVLFREPTEKDKVGPVTYTPQDFYMEYFLGNFTGLFELIRSGKKEVVTIEERTYSPRKAQLLHDGKTIAVYLVRTN